MKFPLRIARPRLIIAAALGATVTLSPSPLARKDTHVFADDFSRAGRGETGVE